MKFFFWYNFFNRLSGNNRPNGPGPISRFISNLSLTQIVIYVIVFIVLLTALL